MILKPYKSPPTPMTLSLLFFYGDNEPYKLEGFNNSLPRKIASCPMAVNVQVQGSFAFRRSELGL